MNTPDMGHRLSPNVIWAADNGRFNAPDKYSDERYLAWLDKQNRETCLFATAPDVVGDAEATLALSCPMLNRLRDHGYKAAFVAQDGLDEPPWDEFDALFVGGTTAWKLGASVPRLVRQANERGKWTHMGRVNSYRRFRLAALIGCDSADGTFLKFGPDKNLPRLLDWLRRLENEPFLPMSADQDTDPKGELTPVEKL